VLSLLSDATRSSHRAHGYFLGTKVEHGDTESLMEFRGKLQRSGDLAGVEEPLFHKPGLLPTQNIPFGCNAVSEVAPIG
jgi:hypothetical protein